MALYVGIPTRSSPVIFARRVTPRARAKLCARSRVSSAVTTLWVPAIFWTPEPRNFTNQVPRHFLLGAVVVAAAVAADFPANQGRRYHSMEAPRRKGCGYPIPWHPARTLPPPG